MFLIRSATINMSNVSDDGSEEIDIDYSTQQQLRAMNVTTDGKRVIKYCLQLSHSANNLDHHSVQNTRI